MGETPPLPDLILSLEQATFMAKQLPNTDDPTHLLQIYSSLHHAHQNLSNFLSKMGIPLPPPAAENSISSATGAVRDENGNDPMQVGDNDEVEVEENSKVTSTIEEVEDKMRECFIRNKRPKRPLSPSAAVAVEEQRLSGDGFAGRVTDFDPLATKLRALDLIYQFHG
ncbi:hypothetical protein L6164_000862 [Bauhinia variegata]|nr:hypothetical protein L6164_000862 [Bauhinia variegata]